MTVTALFSLSKVELTVWEGRSAGNRPGAPNRSPITDRHDRQMERAIKFTLAFLEQLPGCLT
jgi:hypothetical protein